jgi:hypothetical protein
VANIAVQDASFASQETQEALTKDAGFLLRVFPRERRHAELGYLLPFYLGLAVKTRCVGPSPWHALYIYPNMVRTFGYAPVGHHYWPVCLGTWRGDFVCGISLSNQWCSRA